MDRDEIVLAALASSNGDWFTPVQIQKMLFLLDREIPSQIGGPHFSFFPYDYGPFDPTVYSTLEELQGRGLVEIDSSPSTRWRKYRATPDGLEQGRALLGVMPSDAKTFVLKLSDWVRSLRFEDLVSAIYRRYPEMKARSVFRG